MTAVEEQDRTFFDQIYQLWARTTGAEDLYWVPEPHFDNSGRHNVYAVSPQEDVRKLIASGLTEVDAEFITGLHGALPDLVRLLHAALDEADRADYDRDARECRIAELEQELSDQ